MIIGLKVNFILKSNTNYINLLVSLNNNIKMHTKISL